MTEESCLSDYIQPCLEIDCLSVEDVKEFIKRLKEIGKVERRSPYINPYIDNEKFVSKWILIKIEKLNELAGEKLVGGKEYDKKV